MRYWAQLTTTDFATLPAGAIAILPVAAIEQHGPHLPLGTDAHIAEGFLVDAAQALATHPTLHGKTLCLPMQSIGHSPEHTAFAGTLSAQAETFIAMWCSIGASLARAGVKKLLIINSHGGNSPLLDIIARRLQMEHGLFVAATHWLKLVDLADLVPTDELKFGIHGGQVETSLMRSIAPHLVRMEHAVDFKSSAQTLAESSAHLRHYGPVLTGWATQELNPTGALGNAAAATVELGHTIRQRVQVEFVKLLEDVERL